jgi:hypothetical protein
MGPGNILYAGKQAWLSMDIQKILVQKIEELPEGGHFSGLRAVQTHIGAAMRHHERGLIEADDSAFTDVIFRCNQAFEGSVKEAYRVLAREDPNRMSIHDIEKFLGSDNRLRQKVLQQFTRYRQEWRNPSTHDHTLDFDDAEALLAIVSVTAFAIVLCDQIAEQIAFDAAAAAPTSPPSAAEEKTSLMELVIGRTLSFLSNYDETGSTLSHRQKAMQLEGALGGFLASEFANFDGVAVSTGEQFAVSDQRAHAEADIVVSRGDERVILELKRTGTTRNARLAVEMATTALARFLMYPGVVGGLAVAVSQRGARYEVLKADPVFAERIRVIAPARKLTTEE